MRTIVTGEFYHLYNRGNHKDRIFHEGRDYERFLWLWTDAAGEYGVEVAAYCLMPNHYHALVRERAEGGLVRMMRSFSVAYSMYYNRSYGQVGHLFQGRYQTRLIRDEADLLNISRYIHQNPLEIMPIERYEWSSYHAYLGAADRHCDPTLVIDVFNDRFGGSYETFCQSVKRSVLPITV